MNVHSHLGGAVLFVALLFTFPSLYFSHYESTTWADMTVFVIFLSAAIFCLFSSAFYHTFSAHSRPVRTFSDDSRVETELHNVRWLNVATRWTMRALSVCTIRYMAFTRMMR